MTRMAHASRHTCVVLEVFFVLALVYLSEFLSSDTSEDVIAERSSEAKESLGGDEAKGKDGDAKESNKGWKDAGQIQPQSLHVSPQFPRFFGQKMG